MNIKYLERQLGTKDPEWTEFLSTIPETYWARYDLSAVRIGWEAGRLRKDPADQVPGMPEVFRRHDGSKVVPVASKDGAA